jgi:hypothetical protein
VGMDNDLKPGPADLERPVLTGGTGGYSCILGDGARWNIPLVQRWDLAREFYACNLPGSLTFKEGIPRLEVMESYRKLKNIGDRTFLAIPAIGSLPFEFQAAAAVELLSANYRIGAEEISLLELLNQESMVLILHLCIDGPNIKEGQSRAATRGMKSTRKE